MVARYPEILETLTGRLASGAYPVGQYLPTEQELCAEFDASRHTVREALRRLVEQGMLTRRPKTGTVVSAAQPPRRYVQSLGSISELFQFALTTHFEVRDTAPVALDAVTAADVGGAPGETWLRVDGVRRTEPGGTVICTTRSYIPGRLAWIAPELPGCLGPFYALIEQRAGEPILDAVQEIAAEPMPPGLAALREQDPAGHPGVALRLLRRYASAHGTLIASYNWHPADTFTYRMQLRRSPEQ